MPWAHRRPLPGRFRSAAPTTCWRSKTISPNWLSPSRISGTVSAPIPPATPAPICSERGKESWPHRNPPLYHLRSTGVSRQAAAMEGVALLRSARIGTDGRQQNYPRTAHVYRQPAPRCRTHPSGHPLALGGREPIALGHGCVLQRRPDACPHQSGRAITSESGTGGRETVGASSAVLAQRGWMRNFQSASS